MKTVIDVVFNDRGVVIYFDDNSLVQGRFVFRNGVLTLEGVRDSVVQAVRTYYDSRDDLTNADIRFLALDIAQEAAATSGTGGSGTFNYKEEEFTPSFGGQTTFILAETYSAGGFSDLSINGATYAQDTEYTVSGTTLTWLDVGFTLDTLDRLVLRYEFV